MFSSLGNGVRIALVLLGFWGALFFSPWLPALCIVLVSLRWSAPECIFLGFCMDLLWLPQVGFTTLPLFTIASVIIVWGLEPLRHEFLR